MKIDVKDLRLIPNLITLFRLLLSLPILFIFLNYNKINQSHLIIVSLILVAFVSDILDGFVARRMNTVSELGKIIDPFADKLLVVLIVTFMWYYNYFRTEFVVIILLRDVLIFIGGMIISLKTNKVISSDYVGKFTVFMIGIYILIKLILQNLTPSVDEILFWIVSFLCLISLINYFLRGYKFLKNDGNI